MNKIILVGGDPNSVNSEIILKSWKKISNSLKKKIYLISNYNLIKEQSKKLKFSTKFSKVKNIEDRKNDYSLKIIDINLKYSNPFNVPFEQASKFINKSLNLAHHLAINNKALGIINCPIDKNLLNRNNYGVTEFLASKCNIKNNSEAMLIWNKKLSVSPVTTHIDVRDISKNLTSQIIMNKIITIDKFFKRYFRKKPKIGILGLNPHNAEMKKNSEEKKVILPSIFKLKKKGIKLSGPLVSDTFFIDEFKNYEVIIGMYHDQVLTPFKSMFKFDAINITLGLKYLRVSPDHGVAKNLILKNKANPKSLIKCLNFINKYGS
tara:strand:- start:920 stop:1882 length:963 start_codon:yes stop_codon:yes gene_type:complete